MRQCILLVVAAVAAVALVGCAWLSTPSATQPALTSPTSNTSAATTTSLPVVGVPSLLVAAAWPEQKLPGNFTHKMRVPRGGTIEITATLDPSGAGIGIGQSILTVEAGDLVPVKVAVDGKEYIPTMASVASASSRQLAPQTQSASPLLSRVVLDMSQKREVRWTFQLPWETRKAAKEHRFEVTAQSRLRGSSTDSPEGKRFGAFGATMKASVTVEAGVSCYDTTTMARLDLLAQSPFCKMETIGKTVLGRDMYLLRITDFEVPAKDKKPLIIIGPYHGDEPSGVETALDFVWELTTKPENRHYLRQFCIYIVPSHNPDGHALGLHRNAHGVDVGNFGYTDMIEPESVVVYEALMKYRDGLAGGLGISHHQWELDYALISFGDTVPMQKSAGWQVIRNMAIRVSNTTGKPMYPVNGVLDDKYTGVRGFMAQVLGVPNFTLENTGGTWFGLGYLMPCIVTELDIYYATMDQMLDPRPVKPKIHPASTVVLPAERTWKIYKTDKPPVIDGKLDETCWKGVAVSTGPLRSTRPGGHTTKVLACYDDANLYVAMQADDFAKAVVTDNNPSTKIWRQDGCEIMLDTTFSRWSYYHFKVNTGGAFSEAYYLSPGFVDEHPYKISGYQAMEKSDGGILEICIPFAAFSAPGDTSGAATSKPTVVAPAEGARWGANFIRKAHNGKPEESWVRYTGSSTHRPWDFNAIIFAGKQ